MQDGTFKKGNRTRRTGYIAHKDIYYNKHVFTSNEKAINRKQKRYYRIQLLFTSRVTYAGSTYRDTAPQQSYKSKEMERPPLSGHRVPLRHSPRPVVQVHHPAGTTAPSVCVSHQQAAHRTTSAGTKREKEEELDHRGDRAGEMHEPRGELMDHRETGASMNQEERQRSPKR